MAIEAVKVPADVQVEEKILGPVSLRQLGIVLVTGGFSYVTWSMTKKADVTNQMVTLGCWIPFILGLAFSFIKINDVSLFRLMLLSFEKMDKPVIRTFGPRRGLGINIRVNSNKKEEVTTEAKPEKAPESSLAELSQLLDKGIDGVAMEKAIQDGDIVMPPIAQAAEPATAQIDTITDRSEDLQDIDIEPLHLASEQGNEPEPPIVDNSSMIRDVLPPSQNV